MRLEFPWQEIFINPLLIRLGRIQQELQWQQESGKMIKQNKTLPYLVSNMIEVLEVNPEEEEEIGGANVELDSHREGE